VQANCTAPGDSTSVWNAVVGVCGEGRKSNYVEAGIDSLDFLEALAQP
jgi:hypothetical protein